jgi:hypothetical protein
MTFILKFTHLSNDPLLALVIVMLATNDIYAWDYRPCLPTTIEHYMLTHR